VLLVEAKGTAFIIYEDIFDAKNACDHLSGFNVCNRYTEHLSIPKTKAGPKEVWLRQVSLHKQSMGIFF
jgi:hypothetical protein